MRCVALTKKKTQCTYSAKFDRYCTFHHKIVTRGGIINDVVEEPIAEPNVDIVDDVIDDGHDDMDDVDVADSEDSQDIEDSQDSEDTDNSDVRAEQRLERLEALPIHDIRNQPIRFQKTIDGDTYIVEIDGIDITKVQENEKAMEGVKTPKTVKAVKTVKPTEYECKCCFTEYEREDVLMCSDPNHIICTMCAGEYVKGLINDKRSVKCMMDSIDHCGYVYTDNQLQSILSSSDYARYLEHRQVDEASQLASACDNYHICPFCSKWGAIVENMYPGRHPQNVNYLTCGNCTTMFCITCRRPYHGNDSCNKIDHATDDQIRRIVDRVIDDATIHHCPKCHTKYSKEDGCNLITCSSCSTMSCFLCDMIIVKKNGQKYWHFSNDPDRCRLYNGERSDTDGAVQRGNADYNGDKVIRALNTLLAENTGTVRSMMLRDIMKRGYSLVPKN